MSAMVLRGFDLEGFHCIIYKFTFMCLNPIKLGLCGFIEQETLSLLLSTGWFQELIRA